MNPTTREMWQVNKYLWLCLLFVVVYVHIAQAAGRLSVPLPQAYGIFVLALLNGAARTYFGWRRGGFNDQRGWVFTLVDVALISVAIRVTGALASDLWLLYFVLVISESLFSSSAQTTILNLCMIAGYAYGTWPERADPGFWGAAITRMFFLVTVASFGLRLSNDRERRSREVARLREQVAASDERARIAREIHDSLGHALVSSILRLELASRLVRKEPDEAEKLLQEEVPALRAAWNEGRNLAFHLRPWEPDEDGFVEGLRKQVARFAERTGLAVDLQLPESDWQCPRDRELCITRIMQEALTNVARHAQAERVKVLLEANNGTVRLVVEDDGVGFDVGVAAGSFGLQAMRERAEGLGGRVKLNSAPGEGVRIEVALPS